jgi:hypothetical protein
MYYIIVVVVIIIIIIMVGFIGFQSMRLRPRIMLHSIAAVLPYTSFAEQGARRPRPDAVYLLYCGVNELAW